MELIVYWNGGDISHHFVDSISYRLDFKTIVVYCGKENRSFFLDDIKKFIVKGD